MSCGITFTAGTTTFQADLSGQNTDGIGGPVIITNYTTSDVAASSATITLNTNTKNFMTWNDIQFISGTNNPFANTLSHDLNFNRCLFRAEGSSNVIAITTTANVATNLTFDSCIIFAGKGGAVSITLTRPTTADFNYAIIYKNCWFSALAGVNFTVTSTGANTFNGGGIQILGCILLGNSTLISTFTANLSTTIPAVLVYSCLLWTPNSTALSAFTSGQIVENYNGIMASTLRSNVTAGANDQTIGTSYFWGMEVGQSWIQHFAPRPFLSPIENSNALNFGFQAGNPTTDALGAPRSQNTSGAMMAAGAFELVNAASSATSPVDTGSNSLKIAGFGYEDFDLPASAGAQTITVKCQFDGSYGGSTYPQFVIIDDTGATVSTTNFTVAASGAWESQTSPSFNPSAAKMYRLRLIAQSTAVAGNTYFDSVITMSQPGTVGFEVLLKGKPFGTLMPSSLAARGIRVGGRL